LTTKTSGPIIKGDHGERPGEEDPTMRTLIPREHADELRRLESKMSQLFEHLSGHKASLGSVHEESMHEGWLPPVDILESKEAIEIRADLPGVDGKDVDVSLDSGKITIRGERRLDEAGEGQTYHRVERPYGVFERSFSVPSTVDPDRVGASFKDGQLTLLLPKREEAKPQRIAIKT
jgi:HSP20 family protein